MSPPAAAPAVRARTHAPPRPLTPVRGPRRISGPVRAPRPARPNAPTRTVLPGGASYGGLALGALALVQRVASHRLLDRLIRGRAWIVLVAFALLGIVTLQLALLKLNTGIGRSLERAAVLQTQNAAISIEDSELASGGKVEATAGRLGMTLVPTGMLKFLSARPRQDAARAASVLSAPLQTSETALASSAQAEGAGSEASAGESSSSSAAGAGETSPGPSSSSSESSTPASAGEESASSSSSSASGSSEASGGEAGAGGGTQASPTG